MQQTQQLPRFLFEDCLDLLRGLVLLAWIGVAAGVAVEVWIRAFSSHEWPLLGGFSLTYNAVLLEFALNTSVLTLLLVQRDWYERIPRNSAHRLRWLLAAVLIWEGLHLFGAFHVTGSLQGPLLPLLPVLLAWSLIVLPGAAGAWLAAYLLVGHLAVLGLEAGGKIHPQGLLADAFALSTPTTDLGWQGLVLVMAVATALGMLARRWTYPNADALTPSQRIDATTGLFRRAFLERRIAAELGRTRRQGGELGLLLLALDGQLQGRPAEDELRRLTGSLIGMLRLESDTPANYGLGVVAVLLPAAGGAEGLAHIVRRLMEGLSTQGLPRLRAVAVVTRGYGVDGPELMRRAEDALPQARAGEDVNILPVGEGS